MRYDAPVFIGKTAEVLCTRNNGAADMNIVYNLGVNNFDEIRVACMLSWRLLYEFSVVI